METTRSKTISMVIWSVAALLLSALLLLGIQDAYAEIGGDYDDRERFAGVWSDGSIMWIADWKQSEVYGYAMDGSTRIQGKTIELTRPRGDGSVFPNGVWGNDTTLWVVDEVGDRLVAHDLNTLSLDTDKDISLSDGNNDPWGVWSDGATVYVSDEADRKIYAYNFEGTRRSDADIALPQGITVRGIWSDGRIMWVVDNRSDTAMAFNMHEYHYGTRQKSWDISFSSSNTNPAGVWSDGDYLRVTDYSIEGGMHAYKIGLDPLTLDPQNTHLSGIWSDGYEMWISDWADEKIYAYDTAGNREPDFDINVLGQDDNNDVHGIWSNSTTMYALDWRRSRIYAYNLPSKTRDSEKDIRLASDNDHPTGIWSDFSNILVADTENNIAYAYLLWDKAYNPGMNISLTANTGVFGLWSDGSTLWAVDGDDGMIYAYARHSGERRLDSDIRLDVENVNARGMWGQNGVIMVLDDTTERIFRYKIPGVGGL